MSTYYVAGIPYSDNYYNELYHHGIKGQKWGIRRYQNEDGTLTNAGRARYSKGESEHDLGIGNKKRLNTVDKRLLMYHNSYKNAEDRSYQKAAKAQFKGRDATKYINRAKQFAQSAKMFENMSKTYQSLDMREQKRIARRVSTMELGGYALAGPLGIAVASINNDRYLVERLT